MKIVCEDLKLINEQQDGIYIDTRTKETKIIIPFLFADNEIKEVTCDYYSQRIQKTIEEIIIEEGIEKIGLNSFENFKALKKISLPNSLQGVAYNAFEGCSKLVYNEYKNGKYLGNNENPYLVLMEIVNKNEVLFELHNETKIICETAFSKCNNLIEIKLNNKLEKIEFSLKDMNNLKELTIPASVKYITNTLIYNCINFENIIFEEDENNKELNIVSNIINSSNKIETIKLPKRLKMVKENLIENCPNLKTFDFSINSKVQEVSSKVFNRCYQVKNILNIPTLANIDEHAFINTYYYTKKIDDSLIKNVPIEYADIIPNGNQYQLKRKINASRLHLYPIVSNQYYINIVLGEEVKDVEELIFHEGVVDIKITTILNARYIELPKTFNNVDILIELIEKCPKLEMLYIHGPISFYNVDEANFVICYPFEGMLYWDDDEFLPNLKKWISYNGQIKVSEIHYEDGIYYQIKENEARVLKVNENLDEVVLEDFVLGKPLTKIRNGAFKGFKGSKLVLPNTLVEIGDRAFKNANRLKYLVFPESLKTIGSKAFEDSYGLNIYAIGEKTKRFGSAKWNPSKCTIKYFKSIDKLNEFLLSNINQDDDINDLFETKEIFINYGNKNCTVLKENPIDKRIEVPFVINGYRSKYVYLDEKFKDVEEIVLENGIHELYLDDLVDFKLKRLYLPSTVNCYNIMKFCEKHFPNLELLYVESKSFHHDNTMVNCDFVVCLSYYDYSALQLDDDELYPKLDFWVKIYPKVKIKDLILDDGVYYLKFEDSYHVIKVDNDYETVNIKESINGVLVSEIGPCAFYGSNAKNINVPDQIEISSHSGIENIYFNSDANAKNTKPIKWIPTFIQPTNQKLSLQYLSNDIFEYKDVNGVIYNCSIAKCNDELVCMIRKIQNGLRSILEVPSYIYNMKVISATIYETELQKVKTLILGNNLKEIELQLTNYHKKEILLEKIILEKNFSMDYGTFLQCVIAKLANSKVECTFEVDFENEKYCSINGILYSKDKKILLSCRKALDENDIYPENLETIAQYALYRNQTIGKELPLSVKNIYDYNICNLKEDNKVEVFGKHTLWPIEDDSYHAGKDFLDDELDDVSFFERKKIGIKYHYFIGENVKFIHPDAFCLKKGQIHISNDNQFYFFKDGFLLSKDKKFLISCLSTRKNLTIPDGVEYILADLFDVEIEEYDDFNNAIRNKIVFPSTIKKINFKQKYNFSKEVKKIYIDSRLISIDELNDYLDDIKDFVFDIHSIIKKYDYYNFTNWNKEARKDLLSFISSFNEPCYEEIDGILYLDNGKILYKVKNQNIKKIIVNENVKEICSFAFKDSNVEEIVLNTGLEVIRPLAFMNSKIKELIIPSTVKVMDNAFQDIRYLEKISLNNIEQLDRSGFQGCIMLKEVDIPSLKSIDLDAFNTTSIKEVNISKDVKEIKCNYSGNSNKIECINVDGNNEKYLSIEGVVYTKDGSELLFYPPAKNNKEFYILDSTNTISSLNAFAYNDNLETIIFPKYKNKLDYIKEKESSFVNTAFLNYYERENKKHIDLKEAVSTNPINKIKEKEILKKNIKIIDLKCYENTVEGKAKSEYTDNLYDVNIKNESGYLIGRCSCMAYKNSKCYCKHLYALLYETQKYFNLSNNQLLKDKKTEKEYSKKDIAVIENNKLFNEDLDDLLKDINDYLYGKPSKEEVDDMDFNFDILEEGFYD